MGVEALDLALSVNEGFPKRGFAFAEGAETEDLRVFRPEPKVFKYRVLGDKDEAQHELSRSSVPELIATHG